MSALSAAVEAADLQALIVEHCGPDAVRGLHATRGGVICDPRPGHEERNPSFSVYKAGLVWRWKRHGGDEASGTAYDFLLELGYSGAQASETLLRRAGLAGDSRSDRCGYSGPAPQPVNPLAASLTHLSACSPLSQEEQARVPQLVAPLHPDDSAALELTGRGLWPLSGTGKLRRDFRTPDGRLLAHSGALTLEIRGPDGQPWALKVRNLGTETLNRYVYRIAGHGNPAHCSEGYGQADAVLLVEGELNGAAAVVAARAAGLSLDVQGLASAGGVPHLTGLSGRPVFLYFDGDHPGRDGLARVARIAQVAGATEVLALPALTGGLDFCDLLSAGTLVSWLTTALRAATPPDFGPRPDFRPPPEPKKTAFHTAPSIWGQSDHQSSGGIWGRKRGVL